MSPMGMTLVDDHFYKFFTSYKKRNVHAGQRVEVYRNLKFKDKIVYSVRDAQTGLVLGHASNLMLSGCKFVVNQNGRDRVLRERKKNVHAWIEGRFGVIHAGDDRIFSEGIGVCYNPYTNNQFEKVNYGGPIFKANVVYIQDGLVSASGL